MEKIKSLALLMSASLALNSVPAMGAGVEAVQLDYVPLDSSVKCNRIFFRSSQHFKNTIFAVPRVVVGGGPLAKRTFDIDTTDEDGENILSLRLYFPQTSEKVLNNGASQYNPDIDSCNPDKVKAAINRNIIADEDKIKVVSRLPLTSIDVSIPGIKSVGRIGRNNDDSDEADVINYYGTSLTAIFKISDDEKRAFEAGVLRPDGLVANVKFRFVAKHRDGSVRATIDTKTLASNFSAAVKGRISMAKADVSATLRTLNFSNSIKIVSEASRNGSLEKVESMILEQAMKELAVLPETKADQKDKEKTEDPGDAQVSVKAVADMIATKLSRTIEFQQITAPEVATAHSQIRITAKRISDPNVDEIEVKGNYADPSTRFQVSAGQTFIITPAYSYTEEIKYPPFISYFTTSEIEDSQLAQHFPNIVNTFMKIENQDFGGEVMAIGRYQPLGFAGMRYRWKHIEHFASRQQAKYERFERTFEELANIPVDVSFSGLDARAFYKLTELVTSNPYWDGSFDQATGRILIKAKVHLGAVRFRERMKRGPGGDVEYQPKENPIVLDSAVEEVLPLFGSPNYSEPKILKVDDDAIIKQRTIVFNVSRLRATGEAIPPVRTKSLRPATKSQDPDEDLEDDLPANGTGVGN